MRYLREFLSFNCAPDIISLLSPIQNMDKEITEAMAIRATLKKITLKAPHKYHIFDMCAGNGLVGALCAFTLPVKSVTAIDKRERNRKWEQICKFTYLTKDILNGKIKWDVPEDSILVGCHTCGDLAIALATFYNMTPNFSHLVLMPCCEGKQLPFFVPEIIREAGRYETWTYQLNRLVNGTYEKDLHCLSPKNNIIVGIKGWENVVY